MESRASAALLYGSPLHVGGVESHLLALLRHGRDIDWHVMAPMSPDFARKAASYGAKTHDWKPAHALDLRGAARAAGLLRDCGADVVHIHSPRAALPGAAAARWVGVPAVVTVHLPSYYPVTGHGLRPRLRRSIYRAMERLIHHELIDRLIYVSRSVHDEALSLGIVPAARTRVIQNGVDPRSEANCRSSIRETLGVPPEATVACYVGRLDPQKGVDVLLEAFRLADVDGRAWLLLAGDGSCRDSLEAQASRLGLSSRVRFLGFRDDVPRLLEACDLFVLPSRYEACSIALLEAMTAGLPCIATDTGETAELLSDDAGVVVPIDRVAELAGAIDRLLRDGDRRKTLGMHAALKAREFGTERMVARTLEVYDEARGRR